MLFVLVAVLFLAGSTRGCYAVERPEPGVLEVQFRPWVWMTGFVIVGLLAIIGAWMLFIPGRRVAGFVLAAIAGFAGILIVPSIIRDRLSINAQRLEQTTGFWLNPRTKGFALENVEQVVVEGSLLMKDSRWRVIYHNGHSETIDPGDLWESNESLVFETLRFHDIDVSRQ